ncbi:unnamed protein product, partial [Effrenium voratum]
MHTNHNFRETLGSVNHCSAAAACMHRGLVQRKTHCPISCGAFPEHNFGRAGCLTDPTALDPWLQSRPFYPSLLRSMEIGSEDTIEITVVTLSGKAVIHFPALRYVCTEDLFSIVETACGSSSFHLIFKGQALNRGTEQPLLRASSPALLQLAVGSCK